MSVKVTDTITPFLKTYKRKRFEKLSVQINKQSLLWAGGEVKAQMSGRRGNVYLNRQSGHLAGTFAKGAKTAITRKEIITRIEVPESAHYVVFHENGTKFLPKRLFLQKAFETKANRRYKDTIERVMRS